MTTAITRSGLSGPQLATLKRTIAKDLTDIEFDLFMEACRSYSLDPFRKQIIPAIYNANDANKRNMTLITTRDGLRVIASRQGNYRPASEPPVFEYKPIGWEHPGEGLPPNPLKIESVTVTLYKKDADEWFPIIGRVYWDEYAPAGRAWQYSQWPKMPRVMIAKCAEAAALRAGWPDAFAGLYVAEEMVHGVDAADESASQALHRQEEEQRRARIGRGILFDLDGTKLEKIPTGEVVDRVNEMLRQWSDDEVLHFRQRNELGLQEFWAAAPGDALELKKLIEPRCDAALTAARKDSEK